MRSLSVPRIAGLALAAVLACATAAAAQSPKSADQQSSGSFTGIVIITSDTNWYQLFSRPETPHIRGKDHFASGEDGALAIIFSNAQPAQGKVRVECDVTAFDPNGSSSVVKGGICYEGPYLGDNVLHPALLDVRFGIGPKDPAGRAGFKVTLRDAQSRRRVNLAVGFMQGAGE